MTGFCRIFDGFVARDLLHEDRSWIRPEILKKLKSYERSLENLIEAAQANLDSLGEIQRKFNRRDPNGLCWHEPRPINLMEADPDVGGQSGHVFDPSEVENGWRLLRCEKPSWMDKTGVTNRESFRDTNFAR